MRSINIRACIGIVLLNMVASTAYAQDVQLPDEKQGNGVLELSKAEQITELLMTSYPADLAMHVAVRTAECTKSEPRCAPLFFAQDVVLGPWNFIKLLRVTQEQADPDPTIVKPRDVRTPDLSPSGVLPAELVSLAEYAFEQQVALYEQLEAWQITLERLNAAVSRNDEATAKAQRRALDVYNSQVSTSAARVSAASLEFLDGLTPLMTHFASAISVEDADAGKNDLRDNGFGAEFQERFSAFGIGPADRDLLLGEMFAVSDEAPVDLMEGLAAVAKGYDTLADLTTVSIDGTGNVRPVANAGPDQFVPAVDGKYASVTLSGTGSTDREGGALDYIWTIESMKVSGSRPTITIPVGTHHIALTVTDLNGGTDIDLVTITVTNAAAPQITALTATPDVLTPSNRQLIPVELDVRVTDNDDPAPFCQIVSVGVNEPARDASAGAAEPDVVLDGTLTVLLRAEHSVGKANRVYSVTVQCTDKTNHSSYRSVLVSVPR